MAGLEKKQCFFVDNPLLFKKQYNLVDIISVDLDVFKNSVDEAFMFQSENQQLLTLNNEKPEPYNEKPEPCFWFPEQNDLKNHIRNDGWGGVWARAVLFLLTKKEIRRYLKIEYTQFLPNINCRLIIRHLFAFLAKC